VQTEKLASLGRLSAGIIHEITSTELRDDRPVHGCANKAQWLGADQRPDYEEILKDVGKGSPGQDESFQIFARFAREDAGCAMS